MSPIMSLGHFKIMSAFCLLVMSLAASYWPLHKMPLNDQNDQEDHEHALSPHVAESLAGGCFLSIALFHLLPNVIASQHFMMRGSSALACFLLLNLIVLSLWCFEKITQWCAEHTGHNTAIPPSSYAFIVALSLHAVLEGLTLGTTIEWMHSLIIFIAITIHKSSECFAFTVHIRKRVTKIKLHVPLVIGFIILTPMAILLGTTGLHYFATVNSLLQLIHLLSAGILFYIAITHNLIHVLHDATHRMLLLALFCFSAILVGSLALVV